MDVDETENASESMMLADDGVFKVTMGPASKTVTSTSSETKTKPFQPAPRMNSGLTLKHNILYVYGGMYEDGNKQVTFSDLYAIDVKKMDEWKTIIADDTSNMEWLESSSSEDEEESESEAESDEEEDE